MILAIDVYYFEDKAKTVGVLFEWDDAEPREIITSYSNTIDEYIPGEFYRRELPCIEKLIKKINLNAIELIIIDGHVYVDNNFNYGLGGYVWESLNKTKPIIGVAKNSFYSNKETTIELFRGKSKKALFISSIGIENTVATHYILNMKGEFRIPSILKKLDQITKENYDSTDL